MVKPKRAILLPGNGIPPHYNSLEGFCFYSPMAKMLRTHGIQIELPAFPEGEVGYEWAWKAFAKDTLGLDETTMLIGHSTGAVCAMRLMEECRTAGVVLVAGYHTDLGDSTERESGYFSRPWDWDAMKRNTPWTLQFHSKDDPLVPFEEASFVATQIDSDFRVATQAGHFSSAGTSFLIKAVESKIISVTTAEPTETVDDTRPTP
jgi:predicted alpha/beta hydrolase family esterase